MPEITANEAIILKLLADSKQPIPIDDIIQKTKLADSAVSRATLTLSEKNLVKENVERVIEARLTDEGRAFSKIGLPERIVASIVVNARGRLSLRDALRQAGLNDNYASIVTGWIARKKWGKIERNNSEVNLVVPDIPAKGQDEEVLEQLAKAPMILKGDLSDLKPVAEELERRKMVELRPRTLRQIEITSKGRSEATPGLLESGTAQVSSLTGAMIVSGNWKHIKLRSYNVASDVPPMFPGKRHPYLQFLHFVKEKLVALGFQEVTGPYVEITFVNNDMLFMPQDHPAREIHDLYYVKEPSRITLEDFGGIVNRVANVHENGWKTGSKGWGYKYSSSEASKRVLRSHGTALSARTMISKNLKIPGKYFAIARTFRPDLVDRTHLTEFNQAEGIVLDQDLNLRNLLGILEMFAKEVGNADKVRFKPDYFPFTEPSIELQAYKEGYGWMEFGGSGIFRPEVTEPLNIHVPVLAWGLGIDRLYMMKHGIHDIRQLFTPDLEWIRTQPVV